MRERGFSDEEMQQDHIRVGKSYMDGDRKITRWSGRIIFPYIERGRAVYIVGRSYNRKEPKYINSRGGKGLVVYGIERLNGERECILCEGIISARAAERATGVPAVSFLGKSGSSWQLSKLRTVCDRVYLSLDGGVGTTGTGNLRVGLTWKGFQVHEVTLPDKLDPDDLKGEYVYFFTKSKKIFASSAIIGR